MKFAFPGIGTVVNVLAIVIGGVAGLYFFSRTGRDPAGKRHAFGPADQSADDGCGAGQYFSGRIDHDLLCRREPCVGQNSARCQPSAFPHRCGGDRVSSDMIHLAAAAIAFSFDAIHLVLIKNIKLALFI